MDKSTYIKNCLYKANEDISGILKLSENDSDISIYSSLICFHAQQAVEKFLKAFLIYNDKGISKTHDLIYPMSECITINRDFITVDLKDLTEFSVDVRYPDDFYIPEYSETKYYISVAFDVKNKVESLIRLAD